MKDNKQPLKNMSDSDIDALNEKGRECFRAHDYENAFKYFEQAAFYNHPKAKYNVGVMHERGRGTDVSFYLATECFREAAYDYVPEAMLKLGEYSFDGIFTEIDYKEAREWFTKAASYGVLKAYYYLGLIYWHGLGVEKDYLTAIKNFEKTAYKDDPYAQYYLGYAFYRGICVHKDYDKAFFWFEKSASLGNDDSKIALAYLYRFGHGTKADINKAREILLKCKRTLQTIRFWNEEDLDVESKEELKTRNVFDDILPPDERFDFIKRLEKEYKSYPNFDNKYEGLSTGELLEKCSDGVPEALYLRASRLIDSKNYRMAYGILERIANDSYPRAYVAIGYMYHNGFFVKKDDTKAEEYYKKAASLGDALALCNLAKRYNKDKDKYLYYLNQALDKGYYLAQEMMFINYQEGRNGFEKSFQKALPWGEKAAKNGSLTAQIALWKHYHYTKYDYEKAYPYLKIAAMRKDANSLKMLAYYYEHGIIVEQSESINVGLLTLAAENDSNLARCDLGIIYHKGNGVRKNDATSIFWLDMAVLSNSTLAKTYLKRYFDIVIKDEGKY